MRIPVGFIAAAIAVPLVYGTLRKLYPAAERAPGEEGLAELASVHHRTEVAAILVFFFVLTPLCTYLWWLLLCDLAAYKAARMNDAVTVITPGGLYWVMVALLPGATTAAFPADLFVRVLKRSRYGQWLRYLELKHGHRQQGKGVWIMLVLLALPALVLVLLTLNWYFALTQDQIRINTWLGSERIYDYDEVSEILMEETVFTGDYVRRIYEFRFNDGYAYSTTPGLIGGRQDSWTPVARSISQRSGVPISQADLAEP